MYGIFMSAKKKIVILGHVPLLNEEGDMIRTTQRQVRWVYDQAKALKDQGKVEVVLVGLSKLVEKDMEVEVNGLRVVYLKAQNRARLYTLFIKDILRIKSFIAKEKPDLVHVHGTEDAYALSGMFLNCPVALTIQGLYSQYNRMNPVNWLSPERLLEWLEKISLNQYQQCIVKSKHVKEQLGVDFTHLKCSIIPNTVSEQFVELPMVQKKMNKVAYIGSVIPRKGFHHMREAFELIGRKKLIELHIFGDDCDTAYSVREKKLIEKSGHVVVVHGRVAAVDIANGLADANFLIAPSYAETFGNQVIEGMLSCCKCIVTDNTGMAENVRKFGYGLIVPIGDAKMMATEILSTDVREGLSQEESMKRIVTRENVLQEMSPTAIANKLYDYYDKFLSN